MRCNRIKVNDYTVLLEGGFLRTARLEEEWFEDVKEPSVFISALREASDRPDIATFWQRLPDTNAKYSYHTEHDSIAALPITTYEFWLEKQIDPASRNKIKKSQKKGIVVRRCEFDDDFVRGMVSIFNETPIRQGRRFLHYGKDFNTIKSQFSRYLFREEIFGAYIGDELVGFIMMANAGKYAVLGQIISKMAHRDKAPNNALLAKAVERCAELGMPYLAYAFWLEDTLGDFKRNNGFQKFDLPRYYVPLTTKGAIALKFGIHHNWRDVVPKRIKEPLKRVRTYWQSRAFTWNQALASKSPKSV
jgi:hypothetical protein